jgi:hypothetical protein
MKNDISYRTININKLSGSQKREIADEIYGIYLNIFQGWSQKEIYKHISAEDCVLFKVRIFQNEDGKSVGFCWINARHVHHDGKRYTIFFNLGGLDRTVRKKGLITSFFTSVLVKYVITHPFEKIYSFQRLIHPASYCAWANALHEMYPRPDKSTPQTFTSLTSYLSRVFHYNTVRDDNPFVVYCENYVKLDLDGDKPVVTVEKPEAAFFNSLTGRRPDHSVVMIFPCNLKNAVMSVSKNLNKNIRRRLQA